MRINQNTMAINAYRNLSTNNMSLGKSLEKLSSGFRINRAADDASGLVISQGLRAQIGGLQQATRNAQDGISVVQTAEGALSEVHNILNRMRDLAVQSANTGSSGADARAAAQAEITQLSEEVARISSQTSFGGQNLLDGSYGRDAVDTASPTAVVAPTGGTAAADAAALTVTIGSTTTNLGFDGVETPNDNEVAARIAEVVNSSGPAGLTASSGGSATVTYSNTGSEEITIATSGTGGEATVAEGDATTAKNFQIGANAGEVVEVIINPTSLAGLGIDSLDVGTQAQAAITAIDGAIGQVSALRGELGAVQNRFESMINNLQVTTENLVASESRIRDTDMATEMTKFTKSQILQQASTAMLAQANQVPQSILSLLG